ncbi:hypothetical protein E2C01_011248 [Portunus trituberculatus]|uniref:Uncharacterized protein n=1 Tax=Portunus trituberculatus TaxID=210409 RepID=A0A5B7DAL7_PORTR|nr:hypothetical protein [Portunus trituberculatus]
MGELQVGSGLSICVRTFGFRIPQPGSKLARLCPLVAAFRTGAQHSAHPHLTAHQPCHCTSTR